MKILQVGLYNSKYGMGGAEQMLFELACTMKEDYGDEVACAVNSGDLDEKLKERGIRVTTLSIRIIVSRLFSWIYFSRRSTNQKPPSSYRQRLRIFLAGDGSLREDLKNQIRKAGVEDVFIFLGYSREVPELLSWCDALTLPSLWKRPLFRFLKPNA